MKSLYLLFACCLIVAGCSSGIAANSGAGQAQVHKPSLDVKLEVSGNRITVKATTDLTISAEHFGQERRQGEGHIHLNLDNGENIMVKQAEHAFNELAPGKHTLKVSLHNNDHTPYDVTKTVNFEIK